MDHTGNNGMINACHGFEFKPKPLGPINPIINSISDRRGKGKYLKNLIDDRNYIGYLKTLLLYCIPWLALFFISLIAL